MTRDSISANRARYFSKISRYSSVAFARMSFRLAKQFVLRVCKHSQEPPCRTTTDRFSQADRYAVLAFLDSHFRQSDEAQMVDDRFTGLDHLAGVDGCVGPFDLRPRRRFELLDSSWGDAGRAGVLGGLRDQSDGHLPRVFRVDHVVGFPEQVQIALTFPVAIVGIAVSGIVVQAAVGEGGLALIGTQIHWHVAVG